MPNQILVLFAEDDALIRGIVTDVLRDEEFKVIEAGHAAEALDLLQVHASSIHVLFTDIQMPGKMDGLTLAHHVKKHWPWIALLITSGRPIPAHAALPAQSRFLAKPYRHPHVIRHLRELVAA